MASTAPAAAANYAEVGLQVGDLAVYRSSISFSPINKTTIYVHGIVGSTVYLNMTDYYPDNTVHSRWQIITDTVTGGGLNWLYLIAGNLTAGDPAYSGAAHKINETKSLNIGGATRTVNHLNLTIGTLDVYWDKTLGIMVKLNALLLFVWINHTMLSFASSGAPAAPGGLSAMTIVAIAEGVVILILLAYIIMRRGGKRR